MMLLMIIGFFTSQENRAQTLAYNSGTATWVAPAGVTSVQVETWGGGGNGARRATDGAGGGGGGGAYSLRTITVVPGNTYYINAGAGGNGSNSTVANGGDSWFSTTSVVGGALVLAKGGHSVGDSPVGGTGGNYLDGIGDIRRNGGSGSNSSGSNAGGGGSSAGSGGTGNNATNNFGASAPTGGANGGNGRTASDNEGAGTAGVAPGGGGGGSYRTANIQNGGNGGSGRVILKVLGPVFTFDSGNQEWIVPAGIHHIQVQAWGGGGKGGSRDSGSNSGYGGGGSGGYSSSVLAVTPGQAYYYNAGAGSNSASAGGDSWFSTTNGTSGSVVRAKGGDSVPNNTTSGAAGGSATGGTNAAIGIIKEAGASGTNGGSSMKGGDGGTSPHGGAGGTGASYDASSSSNGSQGGTPGGGGGGAYRAGSGTGSPTGGTGGTGRISIRLITPDLSIVNTVSNTSPLVGDDVTFTLTVTNNSTLDAATNVVITDLLPSGLAYVSHSGGTYDNTTGKWTIANLNVASTSVLTILAKVNPAGGYTNNTEVTADQSDLNQENNKSVSTVFPRQRTANLQINKEVNEHAPLVGGTIIFTITAYNSGPENATGVLVQDILPFGFAYQSHSGGTFTNGEWTVGNLNKGSIQTLTITAIVQPAGNYFNNASIHGNEIDPVMSNNTAGVIVNPSYPAKVITLQCLDGVTYDLNPLLAGIDIPSGVVPSWHTATPATSGNTYTGSTTSAPAGMYYVAFYDTVAGCYSKAIPVEVNSIVCKTDLQIVKTVSNPKPKVGSIVTFTLAITNNGPDDATGVVIEDVVPNGYTAITNISNSGNLVGNTLAWSGLGINNAQTQVLTFEAKVKAPGAGTSHDNTASVANSDQLDPDLANNEDSVGTDPTKSLLVTNPMIYQKVK